MQIGELARRCGVSSDTLRLYERQGLLRADRRANGYRDFPEGSETVVGLIRQGQALGFSLGEIGGLMQQMQGALGSDEVADLLRAKLVDIDARILAMQQLRDLVAERLSQACPLKLADTVAPRRPARRTSGTVK